MESIFSVQNFQTFLRRKNLRPPGPPPGPPAGRDPPGPPGPPAGRGPRGVKVEGPEWAGAACCSGALLGAWVVSSSMILFPLVVSAGPGPRSRLAGEPLNSAFAGLAEAWVGRCIAV